MWLFATTAEEHRNLVKALDDFGFDYVFPLCYRYQHEGDGEFARNNYQPDGPVRGRVYKVDGDEWSSDRGGAELFKIVLLEK